MPPGDIARRQFLGMSASAIGTVWLGAAFAELAASTVIGCAGREHATRHWQTFTAADAVDVEAMTALIIPSDDSPGAREAHVIDFIDRALSTFAREERPLFQRGLADLHQRVTTAHPGTTSFAALDPTQQTALLQALEASKSEFFTAVIMATAAGMFANPEYGGNHDKIGWKLIGFEDRFMWQPPFGYYDRDVASEESSHA